MKKNVNLTIDILMYMIFIYQMLSGTVHNLNLHAILGILLFCLFIAHHILNLWFYKSAFSRENQRDFTIDIPQCFLPFPAP